jgi:hypothetical protein
MSNPLNLETLNSLPVHGLAASKSVNLAAVGALPTPIVRGRKPGQTVTDEICNQRRAWLYRCTRQPGKKVTLSKMLSAPDSFVSHLLAGRRTFTDSITRHFEAVLGLAPGTIDSSDVAATKEVSLQSSDSCREDDKVVLDANLAKVLVDFLNQAILKQQVTNSMAIKILVDITPS